VSVYSSRAPRRGGALRRRRGTELDHLPRHRGALASTVQVRAALWKFLFGVGPSVCSSDFLALQSLRTFLGPDQRAPSKQRFGVSMSWH
jgi:hypothetical protein